MRVDIYSSNYYSKILNSNNKNQASAKVQDNHLGAALNQTSNASGRKEMPTVAVDHSEFYNPFIEAKSFYDTTEDGMNVDKLADDFAKRLTENGYQYGETMGEKNISFSKAMACILGLQRARVPLKAKEIDQTLEVNGIKLEENEKYSITVDKSSFITVTGEDAQKAKTIQDVLNNTDYMGYSLNQLTNMYSDRYKVKEDEEYNRFIFHEMDSESSIRELSDGELSLKDLSIKNGKIMGLTPELSALINGTKAHMTNDEKLLYGQIYKVLKNVLEKGIDNIPDLTTNAIYEKGMLTFN